MTYMIPIRRASECGLPAVSTAKAWARNPRARSRSLAERRAPSRARPSLRSDTLLPVQLRPMVPVPPPWRRTSQAAKTLVPGLAYGLQLVCGTYGE